MNTPLEALRELVDSTVRHEAEATPASRHLFDQNSALLRDVMTDVGLDPGNVDQMFGFLSGMSTMAQIVGTNGPLWPASYQTHMLALGEIIQHELLQ